jgi:hypothetical protein
MSGAAFEKPVTDPVAKINKELAVGEDLAFQRRWWRFEGVVWAIFVAASGSKGEVSAGYRLGAALLTSCATCGTLDLGGSLPRSLDGMHSTPRQMTRQRTGDSHRSGATRQRLGLATKAKSAIIRDLNFVIREETTGEASQLLQVWVGGKQRALTEVTPSVFKDETLQGNADGVRVDL